MKKEPLKDKARKVSRETYYESNLRVQKLFLEDDIKSAVEWLKKWINEPNVYFDKNPDQFKDFCKFADMDYKTSIHAEAEIHNNAFNIWIIKKAFPDLYSSELPSDAEKSKKCDHEPVSGWNIYQPQYCKKCGLDL